MQTLVQVVCTKGKSLRDFIVNDEAKLAQFGLEIQRKQQPGRPHGWAKIRSSETDPKGALNIEWDGGTSILSCRVVNKGAGKPGLILGHFVTYLFARCHRRIEAVNIIPRS